MPREPTEYPIVDTPGDLNKVLDGISGAAHLALDTEFVRERTYFPELCVVQVATESIVAAVDCLADLDLDPFFESMLAGDKVWILHSASQDLEVLYYRTRRTPPQLIDTQIAAGLTGMPAQVGLQGLLAELLDVDIGKQHTRADWSRRPLTDALKQYALDDVRHLLDAWGRLEERLNQLGRLEWLHEDCARQLAVPIEPELDTLYDKIKGAGSLTRRHRATARALVSWREERAIARNKPRRWILADDQLVRIAKALPQSMTELKQVRDLPPRLVGHSGSALLEAMAQAETVADPPRPVSPDRVLVKTLQAEVRACAADLGIQPELLATRRDIAKLAAGQSTDSLPPGWRRSLLGEILESVNRDPK